MSSKVNRYPTQTSLFKGDESPGGHHPDLSITWEEHGDDLVNHHDKRITYGEAHTKFGMLFMAATDAGICRASFGCNIDSEIEAVHIHFPGYHIGPGEDPSFNLFISILSENPRLDACTLPVHLRGTAFQLSVWRALTEIPFGRRVTYADLARSIGRPDAVRAVGTAIGRNPVGWLIPCHRVVHTGGRIGHYMWGSDRKRALLEWEAGLFKPAE